MELKPQYFLAAALVGGLLAGCEQSSKSDDVAQKADQPPAMQQAPSQANKDSGTAITAIDDATITTKVKAAIVAEPTLSAMQIKVNTVDGVVTLSGSIDDPQKVSRAQQLAQTIDGVKSVNNELVVKAQS